MGYIGRGQPDRVLTSADIGEGAVTLADISFTDQPANVNITGDYPKQTMRLCDNATVTGDVTISDGLILAKLASDGDSITLTSDGTNRTISGTGLIEANTIAQSPNQSLTGMTGEISSSVLSKATFEGTLNSNTTFSGDAGKITAKAWVNFNGSGTVAIRDSFNVSSVTDMGVGWYRPTWSIAMSNTNYVAVSSDGYYGMNNIEPNSHTTSYVNSHHYNWTNGQHVDAHVNVVVFGD